MERSWAFWRRVQYGTGFGLFLMLVFGLVYYNYFYEVPTCFDGTQNGNERGVDCGGACTRICAFDVIQPAATWARSFRVTDGQYNAVAYIENRNRAAATPEIPYTFSLYDEDGLITERSGTTILPPDSSYPVFESRIDTQGRVPTQTFIELGEASMWVPAGAGSDQFTVRSRTLTNVDARPRLDAILYNNSLTEAREVEVIATIFDQNGNALNSSRTFIDNFPPRAEATAVFTWPEPIAKTLRSCEVPTDVVVAIDLSGSMNDDQVDPPQPISSVLQAAESFIDRLQAGDQAGLVTFASTAQVVEPLSSNVQGVADSVTSLRIAPEEETGSTNTGEAFLRAYEELNSPRHSIEARKVLVLLTDGLATAPDEEPEAYALSNAALVNASGIEVYAIGLGENVNMDFVRNLASAPEQSYQALTIADVDRIYRSITTELCEDGAAIIQIVPKTDASFEPL